MVRKKVVERVSIAESEERLKANRGESAVGSYTSRKKKGEERDGSDCGKEISMSKLNTMSVCLSLSLSFSLSSFSPISQPAVLTLRSG